LGLKPSAKLKIRLLGLAYPKSHFRPLLEDGPLLPDHEAVGRAVDDLLKKHFMGQQVLLCGLGSTEHPGKTVDEVIEIIKRAGTDR
jgi:hypothetical protein